MRTKHLPAQISFVDSDYSKPVCHVHIEHRFDSQANRELGHLLIVDASLVSKASSLQRLD